MKQHAGLPPFAPKEAQCGKVGGGQGSGRPEAPHSAELRPVKISMSINQFCSAMHKPIANQVDVSVVPCV